MRYSRFVDTRRAAAATPHCEAHGVALVDGQECYLCEDSRRRALEAMCTFRPFRYESPADQDERAHLIEVIAEERASGRRLVGGCVLAVGFVIAVAVAGWWLWHIGR